ncbi:MAG: ATP-binding cassette domain-containing protein [Bacteroidetes bacterium]|nr:ATP-binding cassette domain-containing protein [Bacteroidota bacterium]
MIECKGLTIEQGDFKLSEVNFKIEEGEYAVLMGQTGSGKTTILEAICGLRPIKSGSILLDDREISKLKPAEREIGYVPQDGALFSTMNVAANLGFGLRIRKWSKKKQTNRIDELADLLGISHLINRKTEGLSGGEQQRVALGRALSFYPRIICLDEPLSALDEKTKEEMYQLLLKLKMELNITALHISHSKSEAVKLADKVLEIENGVLNSRLI